MHKSKESVDVIVVGGGLSGLAAALLTARLGFSVAHLAPPGGKDPRTSALMMPSVAPLVEQGLISTPEDIGTPLRKIRIIDATARLLRAPETLFDSADGGFDCFGWNFSNVALREAFVDTAAKSDGYSVLPEALEASDVFEDGVAVTTDAGKELKAQMLVGADGKNSLVRRLAGIDARMQKHKQSALVCDLELERPLGETSVEFHYENGPFTLVPAGGNIANLVWIDVAEKLDAAKAVATADLDHLFQQKSQHLFGTTKVVSPVAVFPLSTLSVDKAGLGRVALVGEAAHAFPPIGAQGLNLGLRDVDALVGSLKSIDRNDDNWACDAVSDYSAARKSDLADTTRFVSGLYQSLIVDFLPVQAMRAGGLWALKLSPHLQKRAMAFGMGGQRRA